MVLLASTGCDLHVFWDGLQLRMTVSTFNEVFSARKQQMQFFGLWRRFYTKWRSVIILGLVNEWGSSSRLSIIWHHQNVIMIAITYMNISVCRKGINGWIKLIYMIWSSSATLWDVEILCSWAWWVICWHVMPDGMQWSDEKVPSVIKPSLKQTDSSLQELVWTSLKPPVVYQLLLWWLHVTVFRHWGVFVQVLMVCIIVSLAFSNSVSVSRLHVLSL